MDTPLITKIKEIILSTQESDWVSDSAMPSHFYYHRDGISISYYEETEWDTGGFSIYFNRKHLKLHPSGEENLTKFCKQMFFERNQCSKNSVQDETSKAILNYKLD